MFIRIMTCYAQHRSKGIHHYNKVLIVHCSCYHGYRKKEQPIISIPRDSRLLRLYRGVQLYPHGRTGLTTIPLRESKGCLTPSNLSLIQPECHMKGRVGARSMSRTFPTDATPLAIFMDRQGHHQLLGLSTPSMTCGLYGWLLGLMYSNTRSLMLHKLGRLRSHNHNDLPQRPTPRMNDNYQGYYQDYNIK